MPASAQGRHRRVKVPFLTAPVPSLERDLLDCGVPFNDAHAVGSRYAAALETGAYVEWLAVYIGIFASLSRGMHRTRNASTAAARRLLLLLNDDLGSELFDRQSRVALESALAGSAA